MNTKIIGKFFWIKCNFCKSSYKILPSGKLSPKSGHTDCGYPRKPFLINPAPTQIGFFFGYQFPWTLTQANSMQISNRK